MLRIRCLASIAGTALAVIVAAMVGHARADALFVSNFGANTVTAYDAATGAFLGTAVTAGAEANGLTGIVVAPSGDFFLSAQLTNNVLHYDSQGAFLNVLDPGNVAGLTSPQGLTFGPDGSLYVASAGNDTIVRYDVATGQFLNVFADLSGLGHIGPLDLAFGPDGNLYVTGFDVDVIVKIDGATGAVLGTRVGPPGEGFAAAVFGPDGRYYAEAIDLQSFAGSVYRYDIVTNALDLFIAPGTGGLESAGGIAFGPAGQLLLANVIVDQSFNDVGSTILRFDAMTGAPLGMLVPAGNGLDLPFFMVGATVPAAVPEPAGAALFAMGLAVVLWHGRRLQRARSAGIAGALADRPLRRCAD